MQPSSWTAQHIALLHKQSLPALPLITSAQATPLLANIDLWDMWPVQTRLGAIAQIMGGVLWMVLSAPQMGDPGLRHFHARIRVLHERAAGGPQGWRDLGPALPDGFGPGGREWAGSALLEGQELTLFYTAAGMPNAVGGYQQRLFATTGQLQNTGHIRHWSTPQELVIADGHYYQPANQSEGVPGKIKAFRDPAFFCDPADGSAYLLFTASLAASLSAYNGAVGLARQQGGSWSLLPPLISADGLNNELERPHMIVHQGCYYLFWSTQNSVFNPDGPCGPTGLYGMVAKTLSGPYEPLNGSGLVLCTPRQEPSQSYSWWVLPSLEVVSFIDHWGLRGRSIAGNPVLARASFGGTPAPRVRLALSGSSATLL
jgi:levansucrase